LIAVVPEGYDAEVPHALVFAFHGRTTPNHRARAYFELEAHATRPTLFVYPAGLVAADATFSWHDRGGSGAELGDNAFFDALLEQLSTMYCVDLDRVFVVGHSLGATYANSLGCARGARIRGVGTVAGRVGDGPCSGPVAAMILHNPHDDLVAFEVGLHTRDHALAQDGLEPPGRPCEPTSLRCECYGPPGTPHPVVWCPHTEDRNGRGAHYPHLWPRETGRVLMEFFEELPPPE
jgi:polyhydroxybutyrate depolymerase